MASVRMALWPLMLQNMAGLGQDGNLSTRLCTLMLACFQGFIFGVNFCTMAANYSGNFQIFSVNSKKKSPNFQNPQNWQKEIPCCLLVSLFFKGPVTPTYQWLASPSHREQPLQGTSFTNTVNAQQLQQPPMCQLLSGGHTPDSGHKGL